MGVLHVGHDRRPERRQAHRPHDHGVRVRHGCRARAHGRRRRRARIPVHAHRRDRLAVRDADESGSRAIVIEAFDPPTTIPVIQREGVTLAGSGTPFHMAYLAAPARAARTPLFPTAVRSRAAPRPSRRQLHYDIVAEIGGVGVVSGLRAHRVPDHRDGVRCATPTSMLADTEGRTTPGCRDQGRDARRAGRRTGRGRRDQGKGPAALPRLPRLDRSTPTPSTTTAASAPATSACSTPTGYITITGRLKDVIIRKGENISAKEVEDLLFTHPRDRRRRRHRPARRPSAGERCVRGRRAGRPGGATDARRTCSTSARTPG